MTNPQTSDKCFQCGKVTIITKITEEIISGSLITSTESVCSDPACQKRIEENVKKELARRMEVMNSRKGFYYSSAKKV